jgi:chemotaxis protein histidine kinase CheA
MSHLEALKQRLKMKPEVRPNEGVKIVIGKPIDKDNGPTAIILNKDNGEKAQDILERIKMKKLSNVVRKLPEEEKQIKPIVSKAPVVKNIIKKPQKIQKLLVLEEEEEKKEPQIDEEGEEEMIGEEEEQKPREKVKRIKKGVVTLGPKDMIQIGDTSLPKRLPPNPVFDIRVSNYYMNNRKLFVNFINGLFEPYKDDLLNESNGINCNDIGKDTGKVTLLTHQKIVRDYINLYTPYRGLLLYHGLGSGKTCSSIAIAEGLKNSRKVFIMTPASLRRNYIEEIKKCGDLLFRKNQYWEWISTNDNSSYINSLSGALGLSVDYIQRHKGAWLVNVKKSSNYNDLSSSDKKTLNDQLDEMINNKYTFINYNGLRKDRFKRMTDDFKKNIFDNSVVIIDEAHNLISRIVNKINKTIKFNEKKRGPEAKLPQALSLILYEFLLIAENCRVVLLTGTPIINYPNEIGILFNILRGYIKTWSFTLTTDTNKKISKETLQDIFSKEKVLDYINFVPSSKTLTITRNPFGFENKITDSGYKGVTNERKAKRNANREIERDANGHIIYNERGQINDSEFIQRIAKILKKHDIIAVTNSTTFTVNTALPDTLNEFINIFIDEKTGNVKNTEKFKRRILGLTSYFRSAQEELMPTYDRDFNRHIVTVPMSDYQFKWYESCRVEERKLEKSFNSKKRGMKDIDGFMQQSSSTYRIFSRLACNFAMPNPPGRPTPHEIRYQKAILELTKIAIYQKLQKQDKQAQDKQAEDKEEEKPQAEEKAKAKAKPQAEEKPQAKAEEKAQAKAEEKAQAKAEEKARKAQAKAEEKAMKAQAKAEEKARKEEEKVKEKAMKAQAKAEEKARKEEEKAKAKAEKKKKGGFFGDEEDEDEDEDEDDEDEDEDEDEGDEGDEGDQEEGDEEGELTGGASDDEIENPIEKFIENKDDEDLIDIPLEDYKDEDAKLREVEELEGDELLEKMGSLEYKKDLKYAMKFLELNFKKYLRENSLKTYSPKFLAMLDNIQDTEHPGLHLVYSQFRTMEGIGIFSLVLEANGFSKFKIKRNGLDGWELNMSDEDMGKPCYALYTGTEDAEEREILRNIYNGTWDYIPNNIANQLRAKSNNNDLGEIIKVLMITSAGSEGINLRNTRYVHIMEPYWHPVRIEQVIGRARRICSHQSLPKELQTVDVFIYIMVFTKEQMESDDSKELRLNDKSNIPPYPPQTSDQKLFEISTIKEQLTSQLLKAVKETSIDCATHSKSSNKEGLECLSFGKPNVDDFAFNPNYAQDENDTDANINKVTIDWEGVEFVHKPTGKKYVLRKDTNQVYDYESVIRAKQIPGVRPLLIGKLVKNTNGEFQIVKETV